MCVCLHACVHVSSDSVAGTLTSSVSVKSVRRQIWAAAAASRREREDDEEAKVRETCAEIIMRWGMREDG